MKNELINQFETEMWTEIGAKFLIRKWADGTICKTKNPFIPLRVLVAISTHAGFTPQLKLKQTRQLVLASFLFGPTDALQSHENVLRFFPVWPKQKDAQLGNLRSMAAFLISGALKIGRIRHVTIVSEKKPNPTVQDPWHG